MIHAHALGENPMPYCNGCHPPQENAAPPGSQSSWHARWLRAHSRPRPAVPQRPAPAAPNCTGRSVPVAVLLQRLVPVVVQIAVAKPGRRSVPCYQPRSMQVAAQPDPAAAVDPETDFGGALDMSDRARTSSKQGRWGQWIPCLHVPAPVAGPSAPAGPSRQRFCCRQGLAGAKLPAAGPGPCRMTDLPDKFAGLAPLFSIAVFA